MTDRSILSRSIAAFAGLALVAVATPSFAGGPKTTPEATPEMSKAADTKSNKRICIDATASGASQVTGSMLSKRQCRTAEQWAARGVKVPAQ